MSVEQVVKNATKWIAQHEEDAHWARSPKDRESSLEQAETLRTLVEALENVQTTLAEDLIYQRRLEAARETLAQQVADAILAEQKRVAALPDTMKYWTGDQARSWSNGMSNASRIATQVLKAAQAPAEEPEYEYRVRDAKGRIWKTATAGARPGDVLVRRRKPDEWEEVPS